MLCTDLVLPIFSDNLDQHPLAILCKHAVTSVLGLEGTEQPETPVDG